MNAPLYHIGQLLSVRRAGAAKAGRVVAIFADGARAAVYFRCGRCDHSALGEHAGGEFLGLYDGVVYLCVEPHNVRNEFPARAADVLGVMATVAAGPSAMPLPAPAPRRRRDRAPSERQAPYVLALHDLVAEHGRPVCAEELRGRMHVGSVVLVHDTLARLKSARIVVEVQDTGASYGRAVFALSESGTRWAIAQATARSDVA